ncbi:MAG TPA: lysophospholipid acyltransferase family protein [Polyangiaceae bacterium]|nr:lysophospholipid acyltransferase family protein [Polyangiaceae bacterium]
MARALRPDSAFLRRLAYAGARFGPRFVIEHSPKFFGTAFALALPKTRQRVLRNLRRVKGQRSFLTEQHDVVQTFTSYASCLAESLGIDRADGRNTELSLLGREHLRSALDAGRGVILVTAHIGPWDCAARLLAKDFSADVIVVMLAEPDEAARQVHDAIRERNGVRVMHVGEHPLDALPLLRHVRSGGVVAIQLDRAAPGGRALAVDLFGAEETMPEGPFRLAALSGAPIVPIFAHRLGYFRYEISIEAPIWVSRQASHAQLRSAAASAAQAMQSFISRHPTEWFHFAN